MLLGWYPEAKHQKKNQQGGIPPSFVTVNVMYIDVLKQMTGLTRILNEKYCDCDGTFGLHDYNISVCLRN
jgi:hypothetical protein